MKYPNFLANAALAGALLLTGCSGESRQEIINKRVDALGGTPEYVLSVKYIDEGEFARLIAESGGQVPQDVWGVTATERTPGPDEVGKKAVKSNIYMTPRLFSSFPKRTDIDVALRKEFGNARCIWEGFGYPIETFQITEKQYSFDAFTAGLELCGYERVVEDLDGLYMSGISADAIKVLSKDYMRFYVKLWNPEIESSIGKEKTDSLKRRYFKEWMTKIPGFGARNIDGRTEFYIIGQNGSRLPLPDSVMTEYGTALR
ncbi:MAG: hypothetical protein HY365_01330 [Candidatus Aenigmarchaeota archaeon]|nr:hypothetical protein [Candidatus Aenigmarchaeota archaeon]